MLLAGGAQCSAALAADEDDKAHFYLGLKVWNASWLSYNPGAYVGVTPGGTPGLIESVDAVEGTRKTDTIPVLSMSKGKFAVSATFASYASEFNTPYSAVVTPGGANVITSRTDYLSRKETDVTVAYSVLPNIALSVGVKRAKELRDTETALGGPRQRLISATANVLIFGTSARFPIKGNLSAYGLLGYGPMRLKTVITDQVDGTMNGRYLGSELGLSYALGIVDPYVKGASVGLGYRSQTISTAGVGPGYLERRDYRDVKDGIVFSLTVAI